MALLDVPITVTVDYNSSLLLSITNLSLLYESRTDL
jgi:hypothetical protein